ncbi:hypothetical protein JFK97_18860 [Chromobacterium phragmitis]|uniref:hypothetical protein n=1 Tax=Chromobacterium amazonense TaxID=1382803 RepID=UPI0021B78413|nr:hypothetical protein [Chromobacterium amazonense]MBM2886453.1 hypothetical protein [Chromobacterium amazonense]
MGKIVIDRTVDEGSLTRVYFSVEGSVSKEQMYIALGLCNLRFDSATGKGDGVCYGSVHKDGNVYQVHQGALVQICCPTDMDNLSARQITNLVARHLSHTEMGYVLPILHDALPELLSLDCVIEVPVKGASPHRVCLCVIGGGEAEVAYSILERMAMDVVKSDPYGNTTLTEARALFGLFQEAQCRLYQEEQLGLFARCVAVARKLWRYSKKSGSSGPLMHLRIDHV